MVAQEVLDAVEQVGGDEWFVAAGVFDAAPGDVADVVAVAQDLVQLVRGDRLGVSGAGGAAGKAARFEGVSEAADAPAALGVGVEGP